MEEKPTYEIDVKKFEERQPEKQLSIEKTPGSIIELAVARGTDLAQLKEALELQERWEAREAKKAYVRAMAEFKADPPEIEKTKHVKFETVKGTTEFFHADLADVTQKINAKLSEHGLSASWTTQQTNGTISVTCKITHVLGHSEETTLTASPDVSGSKNPIQAIGSAITYLERYTLFALTGLAAKGMDDDGTGSGELQYIDDKQKSELTDLINDRKVNLKKFLTVMAIESLEKLPANLFEAAKINIKAKPKPEGER